MAGCFLSYSHTALDQFALAGIRVLLTNAGVSYWFDGYLRTQNGLSLNSEIASEMLAADAIVVLASSQYVSSRYCQAEAAFALQRNKQIIRVDVSLT